MITEVCRPSDGTSASNFNRLDLEQTSGSTSQPSNKRRGSVAADFAPPRLIVSERQQMAVLKQLTAGEESNSKRLNATSCKGVHGGIVLM